MPLYEFECGACGARFERIQKFSDPDPDACVACGGGPVRRLLSSPAIQFKGSGWYITDYARKSQKETGESGAKKGTGAKSESTSEKGSTKETSASDSSAPSGSSTNTSKPSTGPKES